MRRTTEPFLHALTDFAQIRSSNLASQVISIRLDSRNDSLSHKPIEMVVGLSPGSLQSKLKGIPE
jgi:hypothetical protein